MRFQIAQRPFVLRYAAPTDAEAHFEAIVESKAELIPWMPWCHAEYARAETDAWLATRAAARANNESHDLLILDCAVDRIVGAAGLNRVDALNRTANLGYWVRTSATGRGIATAATRRVAKFGFEELELERIEIVAAVGNTASQRVAEKAGARREGVLRNKLCANGGQRDAVMFSFLKGEL